MKFTSLLIVVLLSAAVSFGVARYAAPTAQTHHETRFETIKRTGILRCGYSIWPPTLSKDPNTGKFSGIAVTFMEELGRQLGLKIDWAVEAVPSQAFTDLASNRYDIFCTPLFATPARAREAAFTTPILFHPAYLYVRNGDTRFDHESEAANDKSVQFSVIDGEFSSVAADENFPNAKKRALPQNATGAELLLNVADGKADAAVAEPMTFLAFDAANPGKLKAASPTPLRVMPTSFALPASEPDLKNAIDATIVYLHGSGYVDALLKKYETPRFKFLRVPSLYKEEAP